MKVDPDSIGQPRDDVEKQMSALTSVHEENVAGLKTIKQGGIDAGTADRVNFIGYLSNRRSRCRVDTHEACPSLVILDGPTHESSRVSAAHLYDGRGAIAGNYGIGQASVTRMKVVISPEGCDRIDLLLRDGFEFRRKDEVMHLVCIPSHYWKVALKQSLE